MCLINLTFLTDQVSSIEADRIYPISSIRLQVRYETHEGGERMMKFQGEGDGDEEGDGEGDGEGERV